MQMNPKARILFYIGRGGFGPVFYGRLHDGLEVTVKVLSESSEQGGNDLSIEVYMPSAVIRVSCLPDIPFHILQLS